VFSQQSQRYVEIKEDVFNLLRWEEAKPVLDKYFTDVNTSNWQEYLDCLKHYLHHIQMGMKAEDARMILPNATKTNITMSINLRELIHVSNLRLCTRAQLEIRQLFQAIKKEVEQVDERLASLLVPSCEVHNMCFEAKCCGRKPKANEVKAAYKLLGDDTILSNEDWEQLMTSINNPPEVNQKLKSLLEMKSVIDN
jgi:thymidylate synthase (FAD)